MSVGGGNAYKLPHVYNEQLRKQGRLPQTFYCDPTAYDNATFELSLSGKRHVTLSKLDRLISFLLYHQ